MSHKGAALKLCWVTAEKVLGFVSVALSYRIFAITRVGFPTVPMSVPDDVILGVSVSSEPEYDLMELRC